MKQLRLLFVSLFLLAALPSIAGTLNHQPLEEIDGLRIDASVYPNPTNGVFFLNIESQFSETFEVKIVNLIGQRVDVRQVETNQQIQFDLSGLPRGVYFVKIDVDQQQIVKRIILQ